MSPHTLSEPTTVYALMGSRAAILLLGGLITYYSYRAYQRTGSRSLRALAGGFALVATGSLVGGLMHTVVGVDVLLSLVVESVLTAAGFALLLYSLYAEE